MEHIDKSMSYLKWLFETADGELAGQPQFEYRGSGIGADGG